MTKILLLVLCLPWSIQRLVWWAVYQHPYALTYFCCIALPSFAHVSIPWHALWFPRIHQQHHVFWAPKDQRSIIICIFFSLFFLVIYCIPMFLVLKVEWKYSFKQHWSAIPCFAFKLPTHISISRMVKLTLTLSRSQ